jgi:hypothetical protein
METGVDGGHEKAGERDPQLNYYHRCVQNIKVITHVREVQHLSGNGRVEWEKRVVGEGPSRLLALGRSTRLSSSALLDNVPSPL